MKASLYELDSVSKCHLRRSRNISTRSALSTDLVERSFLAKDIIKQALMGGLTGTQAATRIENYFRDSNLPTEATKAIQCEDMKRCINRYLSCETRSPILPAAQEINIFDVDVMVNPDLVFKTKNGLEIVRIRYSRPNIKKELSRAKKTIIANESLEMYSLLQFGRKFITPGQQAEITASMYFLRKDNDSFNRNVFDSDFFDDRGNNVVSISDVYKNVSNELPTELDQIMKKKFEKFRQGENLECDEDKCRSCDFFSVCSFKQAPKSIKSEKVRNIGTIKLTPAQRDAIAFDNGVTRINAGAGAGKTLTISLRAVELLKKGVKPEEICLLTFTNTGAFEMRERIQTYNDEFGVGDDISNMIISTFNAFGDTIIKQNYPLLGFQKEPILIDDIEKAGIITKLLKNKNIASLDFRNYASNTKDLKGALFMTKKIFEIMKSNNLDENEIDKIITHLGGDKRFISRGAIEELADLYCDYVYNLRSECLIDYSDQELLVFELLKIKPTLFEEMGIKHIIVDEYQDSNIRQMNFIKMMMSTTAFNSLMVVGDDSQAIFGFRDTSPEYIINFFNYIGIQGQDFFLLENYRSTPEIIDFANKLNDLNQNRVIKSLIATKQSGKAVVARVFLNSMDETKYIVDSIKDKIKNGTRAEDIAYIAATKSELMKMASLLTEEGIPSVLLNPEAYIDNSKVRAALDMVKAYCNPELSACILNYLNCSLKGGLLNYTDEQIQQEIMTIKLNLQSLKSYPEIQKKEEFFRILENLDDDDEVYESFLDTLSRKFPMKRLVDYCSDFEIYGRDAAVKRKCDYPGVVLTTAHSSKGLEWKIVFNSISKYWTQEAERKIKYQEEKRRLFFVSATRAKDELYITGQQIAYGSGDNYVYNKFMIEAYDILGQQFPYKLTKL